MRFSAHQKTLKNLFIYHYYLFYPQKVNSGCGPGKMKIALEAKQDEKGEKCLQFALGVEILFQVLEHFLGGSVGRVTFDWLSVLVDDEFCEIPLDGINQSSALFFLQVLEKWVGVFAVDVNLIEQIEVDLAILNEALNFLSIARLLMTKLIARESENSQTCGK